MGRDDELRPEYRDLFRKTVFCRFFPYNACSKGDKCKFAHYPDECQAKPDLTKTALCRLWKRGLCQRSSDECPFAHGHQELRRPRPPPGEAVDDLKEYYSPQPDVSNQELYPPQSDMSYQKLYPRRPDMSLQELYPPQPEMRMGKSVAQSLASPLMPIRNAPTMPTAPWDEGIRTPMPEYIPSPKWTYASSPTGTGDPAMGPPFRPLPSGIVNPLDPYEASCRGEAPGQASTGLVHAITKLLEQTTLQQRAGAEDGPGEAEFYVQAVRGLTAPLSNS